MLHFTTMNFIYIHMQFCYSGFYFFQNLYMFHILNKKTILNYIKHETVT